MRVESVRCRVRCSVCCSVRCRMCCRVCCRVSWREWFFAHVCLSSWLHVYKHTYPIKINTLCYTRLHAYAYTHTQSWHPHMSSPPTHAPTYPPTHPPNPTHRALPGVGKLGKLREGPINAEFVRCMHVIFERQPLRFFALHRAPCLSAEISQNQLYKSFFIWNWLLSRLFRNRWSHTCPHERKKIRI